MPQYCCCSDLVHIIIVCYASRTGVYIKALDFIIVGILTEKTKAENFLDIFNLNCVDTLLELRDITARL